MPTIEGTVQYKSDKNGRFAVKMDDIWYGFNEDDPEVEEGNVIKFRYSKNGKWNNADFETLEILDDKVETQPRTVKSNVSSTDWDAKDVRITYMSARNAALELVAILSELGGLSLPKTTKPNPAKIAIAVEAIVEEYTDEFFEAALDAKRPSKTKKAKPASDDDDDDDDGD